MKTEAQILADVMDTTRQLTKFYISKLKDSDPFKEFEVDGKKLNSAYWVIGHIAWTENMLLLGNTGGVVKNIEWLNRFAFGTPLERSEDLPDMKTLLDTLKEIHESAVNHVRTLTAEQLNEPNPSGMGFGGDSSVRMILHHSIRHEALHTGHLSWICKLNGVRTV